MGVIQSVMQLRILAYHLHGNDKINFSTVFVHLNENKPKIGIIGNTEQAKLDRIRCSLNKAVLIETTKYNIRLKKSTLCSAL